MKVQEIKNKFGVDIKSNRQNTQAKKLFKMLYIKDQLKKGFKYSDIDKLLGCSQGNCSKFHAKGIEPIKHVKLLIEAYRKKSIKAFINYTKKIEQERKEQERLTNLRYMEIYRQRNEKRPDKQPLNISKVLFILCEHRKTKRKEIQRLWDKRLINYSTKDWDILRSLNPEYFNKHLIN